MPKSTKPETETKAKRGRKPLYSEDDPKCNMTIVLPSSVRDKLKLYALLQHTTVSDLIVRWADEHCEIPF